MQKTNTKTLTELISNKPDFRKFNDALKSSGLTERLTERMNYTVFAPTDDAFGKLPQDKVSQLFKPENREELKNLLLLHIVPGNLKMDDLKKVSALKTEAGREIKVGISQDSKEIKIGNAKLAEPREQTDNFCFYAVDSVIQPTAGAVSA